jgi:hypothetical protein
MLLNLKGETNKPPEFVSGVSVAQLSCCEGRGQERSSTAQTYDQHGGYREGMQRTRSGFIDHGSRCLIGRLGRSGLETGFVDDLSSDPSDE